MIAKSARELSSHVAILDASAVSGGVGLAVPVALNNTTDKQGRYRANRGNTAGHTRRAKSRTYMKGHCRQSKRA